MEIKIYVNTKPAEDPTEEVAQKVSANGIYPAEAFGTYGEGVMVAALDQVAHELIRGSREGFFCDCHGTQIGSWMAEGPWAWDCR